MIMKKSSIRTWSKLGQRGSVFAVAMPELAKKYSNLKLCTADLSLLSGMDRFIKENPEKFINVGIAEQNMIGMAAGLAMEGDIVFATTYASFIAVRSLEHVRQHLAHMRCNVKIIGSSAGVVAAKSGISHWATEDIAFMRALPGMMVLSPADCTEAIKMTEYAASIDAPVYIRLSGGLRCPIVYQEDFEFVPGRNIEIRHGKEIAILATGLMVYQSLEAAKILEERGIHITVINVNTIKPLDEENLRSLLREYALLVTIEEHSTIGGLGGAIAEFISTFSDSPALIRLGFQDCYLKAGSQKYVWEQAGLLPEQIAERIMNELS